MDSSAFTVTWTRHARDALEEREIPEAWVIRVLTYPQRSHSDFRDRALKHALGTIPEYGDRVLRVVYMDLGRTKRVVTVYFDRTVRDLS